MARLILTAVVAGLAVLAQRPAAQAWPLDAADCKSLKAESEGLVAAGVLDDLKQGPDWAKANASAERIERANRYIELLGTLRFRCPSLQPKVKVAAEPAAKPAKPGKPAKAAPAAEPATTGTTTPTTK